MLTSVMHVMPAVDELMQAVLRAHMARTTKSTTSNADSSRSHAVFRLQLRIRENMPDGKAKEKTSCLLMMDLAGEAT